MKIYLFPGYVSISSASASSPNLFRFLKEQKVELVEESWGGDLKSLPTGEPAFIRASSVMHCADLDLAQRCAELGHFCFYDDRILRPDGSYDSATLIEELQKFLERANKGEEMSKEQVVPYLKSCPKDDSTLGSGEHLRRQTALMLNLWDQHVPMSESVVSSGEFSGFYPIVRIGTPGSSGLDGMGFDVTSIEALDEALMADLNRLRELGLELTSDDDRSRQLCRKLQNGLSGNFTMLGEATRLTKAMYSFHNTALAQANPLGLFMATSTSRHNTDATVSGVMRLYRAMLPALVEKLVTAGYPDTTERIEWDYGEPPKAFGLRMLAGVGEVAGLKITHALTTKTVLTCKQCGHKIEVEIHQSLDEDGKTPKGDPEIRGLPSACPQCGTAVKQSE